MKIRTDVGFDHRQLLLIGNSCNEGFTTNILHKTKKIIVNYDIHAKK